MAVAIDMLLGLDEKYWSNEQKVLHSPFDIETHKKTFIHYLEVMIDSAGVVHYAVPSHMEWCIAECKRKLNMSRDDVCNSMWFIEDMCRALECIAVWETHYIGRPNEAQIQSLRTLENEGLFGGII